MEEDHDGLLWRAPGESVVDGIAPELHAQMTDGGVRHELGEAHELEIERAKGVVGVSSRWWYEVSDQEGIEVGLSSTLNLQPSVSCPHAAFFVSVAHCRTRRGRQRRRITRARRQERATYLSWAMQYCLALSTSTSVTRVRRRGNGRVGLSHCRPRCARITRYIEGKNKYYIIHAIGIGMFEAQ